jgi:hypothetical protein
MLGLSRLMPVQFGLTAIGFIAVVLMFAVRVTGQGLVQGVFGWQVTGTAGRVVTHDIGDIGDNQLSHPLKEIIYKRRCFVLRQLLFCLVCNLEKPREHTLQRHAYRFQGEEDFSLWSK